MKFKDLFEAINMIISNKGCMIIVKTTYGARLERFGNFTNEDIDKYTKGFSHSQV